ncbi:M23 family metallopeptidase [Deinococcus sp. Marseille-Q6407]|uniref:M23 family metallopeptidase n=1 Tax=Deinococcus sp. Marseille-Q6407 TaxID=2969223 RepID=UPI0021C138A4|nr:M23 family metallopeptidase [Deinococcus sp. Marseille-Q6407]
MTPICNPVLETATIKYSVQPGCHWLDAKYYPGTKQAHTGCDLNATTGGDTDYGNRVRCVADGIVQAAGNYPTWGGIVLISHPELGVYTQYAHLINIAVKPGDTVKMGDPVGQIGKGAKNQFMAHLHFEVRKSRLAPDYWPSAHVDTRAAAAKFIREHYLDPEAWLEQHGAMRGYDEVMQARGEGKPIKSYPEVPALPPKPAPATARPERKPIYLWVQVQNPDGTLRPKEVVSIPVNEQGLLLVQANGKPKVVRVPEARLTEGEY